MTDPGQPLAGRAALVTGASSGIGRAIAVELARQGADVCVNYHSGPDRAEAVAGEIAALGRRAFAHRAPVQDAAAVRAMVAATVERLGRLDICVNNAGISRGGAFLDLTEDDWDLVLDVNLKGAFLCAQAAARRMVDQGQGGRIINISSIHEELAAPQGTPYLCSKGGMRMLTKSLALELAPHGITVVGVGPGAIATPLNRHTLEDPERMARLNRWVPLGRIGQPEEVARLVAYLASDAAAYITATTFFIDGGMMEQATDL